jgi:hypothetical protein
MSTSVQESGFSRWTLIELLQSVHESIDWLHRLSNLVRKASFVTQNKRAEDFILGDSEDDHEVIVARLELFFRDAAQPNSEVNGDAACSRNVQKIPSDTIQDNIHKTHGKEAYTT